jgi:hypothetical protein
MIEPFQVRMSEQQDMRRPMLINFTCIDDLLGPNDLRRLREVNLQLSAGPRR